MSEQWKCPQGKLLLAPIQVIETAYPKGRPHLTLPLHKDGSLCGPWCSDAAEAERRKNYCNGRGEIRRAIPGVYGPGRYVGNCPGCPRCEIWRKAQEEEMKEMIEKAKRNFLEPPK